MLQTNFFGSRSNNSAIAKPDRRLSDFFGKSVQPPANLVSNLPSLQSNINSNNNNSGNTASSQAVAQPVTQQAITRLFKSKDEVSETSSKEPEAAVCTVQGKRPYQEDQYAICPFLQDHSAPLNTPETHFYGVFDGHAGGRCSKAIATALPINLAKDDTYKTKLVQAIKRTFSRTNDQFLEIAERMRLNDGSTSICCVIRENKLHVANVGDSRAILISGGKAVPLSKDHKPSAPEEQRRIASFGGVITNNTGIPRVQGVLAVSRAFGNYSIRQYIRADPDIFTRDISTDDDFLVLASDGLWDVYRNAEVSEVCYSMRAQGCKLQRIADHLVHNALLKGSMDNVTCLVVSLNSYTSRVLGDSSSAGNPYSLSEISNSTSRDPSKSNIPNSLKYDSRHQQQWPGGGGVHDEVLGEDLEANVSVYIAAGSENANSNDDIDDAQIMSMFNGGAVSSGSRRTDADSSAAPSKGLSRSRSSNKLKQSSRRTSDNSFGGQEISSKLDGFVSDSQNGQAASDYLKRGQSSQNNKIIVAATPIGGGQVDNKVGGSAGGSGHGSSGGVQQYVNTVNAVYENTGLREANLKYANSRTRDPRSIDVESTVAPSVPLSFRPLNRPMTTSAVAQSSSVNNGDNVMVAAKVSSTQPKLLFGQNTFSNQSLAEDVGPDGFSGSRTYTLFGGNSLVPSSSNRFQPAGSAPIETSTGLKFGNSAQKRYVESNYSRPNTAAVVMYGGEASTATLNRPYSSGGGAYASNQSNLTVSIGSSLRSGPQFTQGLRNAMLPAPHSPISTIRKK